MTYKGSPFFPLPPNKECIESIDMVLHIPIAADYFFDYLSSLEDDPEAVYLFGLYTDLKFYDQVCQETEDEGDNRKY